jgi:hypothetical protein
MRSLMRSVRRLVPGAEMAQSGVGGRPDRLHPVGRNRSLMAYFADR